MNKAVILAAGKSSKFFPPLYDKPKGLFTFNGEVLIERQIRQLQEAGIDEITVVIGYEKEQFFYLEDLFGVDLVVSTRYNDEMSLSSLDIVRDRLGDSLVCCADHWYRENPFHDLGKDRSLRLVKHSDDARGEFVVSVADDGRLSNLRVGVGTGDTLVGYAYFTNDFAEKMFELYDAEVGTVGIKSLHWEQFWGRHCDDLPLYLEECPEGFREFDSLGDLARIDADVLDNVSHVAIENICKLLNCVKGDISDVEPLNKGLTNVSFSFLVGGKKYVYRHPGASSLNMVNRSAEVTAQLAAMELGIDSSVIAIDEAGWKLSHYVEAVCDFSYDNPEHLKAGIEQIKLFQQKAPLCDYTVNLLAEGDRLQGLASNKKGDLKRKHAQTRVLLERLWHYAELDGVPKVLCHNDTYAVNWIVGEDVLCMIDWEYAGVNDPYNDIATLTVRDGLSREKDEELLRLYVDGEPTFEQRRHHYAINALCGWYWFNWSLFKDTLGEDGFFMLPSWHGLNTYLPLALDMYENPEKYKDGEAR